MKSATWLKISILAATCSILAVSQPASGYADLGSIPASRAAKAEPQPQPEKSMQTIFAERRALLDQVSHMSGIPWTQLAAVDQYERTLNIANPKKRPTRKGSLIGVFYSEQEWAGAANPEQDDTNPFHIGIFGGTGRDGSGDGLADRSNDLDLIMTKTAQLTKFGMSPEQLRHGLTEAYKNPRAIERIDQFVQIYETFGTLDLHEHAFVLPIEADYSFRDTWGARRSWGGARAHEGTDLFARYGVPVRSACYGVVEVKGWNNYGGWRIGLRDLNNVYHYYAHLSGFSKTLNQGDVVKPGQVIGYVGSSGYGKPGTSGKFPPHLHYGLYRDTGTKEWSFDPYPYLRKWEREDRLRLKSNSM
ncbi:M23 family metallopeptidase [Paenibacillus koleovorans]|uniref:M23 family metallopeptidase n=1 Tax=Paenibacillus koleovorans TaxID=121608 RepID=UPI000FD7E7E0|nr:M23 family metallopeptidase [Paenibacillus koleovorans]